MKQEDIEIAMKRGQFILLPAFIGGFFGSDIGHGSIPVFKLLFGIVFYLITNAIIYFFMKGIEIKK